MLLMIDIGNTTMNIGIKSEGKPVVSARFPTRRDDTECAHALTIKSALSLIAPSISLCDIGGAVIASVVPTVTNAVATAIERLFGVIPIVVGAGIKTGLNIKIDDPGQLGADLVATAVGAVSLYRPPILIYDMGTATKITVISRDRRFLGGMIYPGVGVSLSALGSAASLLPTIGADAPPKAAIGRNTQDAMLSGIIYGTAGAIDGMAGHIEDETCETYTRVATGGFAPYITPVLKLKAVLREELIFDGMESIYLRNER